MLDYPEARHHQRAGKAQDFPLSFESFKKTATDPQAQDVLKRILRENIGNYRTEYMLAIGCMLVVAAATGYSAYIIKDVVNEVFDKRNISAAYVIAALIFGVFALKGFAGFGQDVLLNRISNNIIARYQKRVYEHMLHLGVSFYTDQRSANLVSKIGQNINGVKGMMNLVITVVIRDFLTLVGLLAVMVVQDPIMTIGSMVVLPVAGYVLSRYVKQMKKLSRKDVNLNARVSAAMIESAQGITILKSFTMEDQMKAKVGVLADLAEKQSNRITLVTSRTKPLTEMLGGIAIAGAVAFGGWRVIAHGADQGALLSFLAASMLAYEPARRLAAFRVQFEKSLVNARMLYELLDTPARQADKPGAVDFKVGEAEIVFDDVSFSYGNGEKVLEGVSFRALPGKTTALVGPSGGGKSTIINLIQRFYDLDSGHIRVDGQDIADVKVASLRHSIAYVSQQPVLFEGSIGDNIRYARPEATQEEVEEAARQAQAHDFIMELPNGYATEVAEMGNNFSGGQRQRLSIARAILRNAPILLLDEATSALDNESEKLVQGALDTLMKGRTTIVVAHRLSTIRDAHTIVVINRGKVVEQGNHAALIKHRSGLYSRLHRIGAASSDGLVDEEALRHG
jgi:ATP-binding cassette, subfamily B, bacterial MsbA